MITLHVVRGEDPAGGVGRPVTAGRDGQTSTTIEIGCWSGKPHDSD